MGSFKKMMYAAAAGLLAGAVLGVLFAPDKGSVTRERLARLRDKLNFGGDDEETGANSLHHIKAMLEAELEQINQQLNQR